MPYSMTDNPLGPSAQNVPVWYTGEERSKMSLAFAVWTGHSRGARNAGAVLLADEPKSLDLGPFRNTHRAISPCLLKPLAATARPRSGPNPDP